MAALAAYSVMTTIAIVKVKTSLNIFVYLKQDVSIMVKVSTFSAKKEETYRYITSLGTWGNRK